MRRFLTTLLAVTALTGPVLATGLPAGPGDDDRRPRAHDRSEARRSADSGERAGVREARDNARADRSRIDISRPDRSAVRSNSASSTPWLGRERVRAAPQERSNDVTRSQSRMSDGQRSVDRSTRQYRGGGWGDRTPTVSRDPATTVRREPPSGAFGSRVAQHQNRQWTRHWRDDRRYDWRSYRDRNRTVFRIGAYYDPYGMHYRRWNIGWSIRPSYYRSSYWISDPWQYRLPDVYGPYRWVRYYDDAILVNTFSGEVVDVIYNFFW